MGDFRPSNDATPPITPDYAPPPAPATSFGCLFAAIAIALILAIMCSFAMLFMANAGRYDFVLFIAACPVALTVVACWTHHPRRNIAKVIVIISFVTYLLMLGLCAQTPVKIGRPIPPIPATAPATLPQTTP